MRRVFTFNYTLKDSAGKILDQSDDGPLAFLEGVGQIIPALEKQLILLSPGDKKLVKLLASEAYGMPEPKMIMDVPKEDLAHLKVELGGYLQLQLRDQVKVVKITSITETHVTLDGNHPLAGQDLEFDVELVEVRDATLEEIQHGHAHGPGGHH